MNITDSEGWTPLHVAAYFQRTLVCHILLKMGADINIKNRDNQKPLDLVKDNKTLEVFLRHMENKENINI